ncbi:MAG: DUF4123 domain-containing protein [Polyangiaceae bacterium]
MTRRAVLRVLWGKSAETKVVLQPGRAVRVGRDEGLELSIPHDRELSLTHFAVDFDGRRLRVRDLASLGGTQVNGEPFTSGEVDSGAWIKAGDTVVRLFIEDSTPPLDVRSPEELARARAALAELVELGEPLFGVLDAARDARILTLLDECVDDVWSLYDGVQGQALAGVAPHLVRFSDDSGLLERVVLEGWGLAWGVFFSASRPAKEVRRHLRRFLMVEPEVPVLGQGERERLYFRYYDPRVLRDFLPIATPRQRGEFFGDISLFLLEQADGTLQRVDPVIAPASARGADDAESAERGATLVPHP